MKDRIRVALVGLGTVGTGVARILLENSDLIQRRLGVPLELVRIVDLDITRDRGISLPPGILSTDLAAMMDDSTIDIVIELIGGYDHAKKIDSECI